MSLRSGSQVLVLGAGVSGLTSAWRLRELGFAVTVWAKAFSPNTTSDIAAALWYPYRAEPEEKVRIWGAFALKKFLELVDDPASGVDLLWGEKHFHRPMGPPWWKDLVPQFSLLPQNVMSRARCGYRFQMPVIDMPVFLAYLQEGLAVRGVAFERRTVTAWNDVAGWPVVVNAVGLGAKSLCDDNELIPIKGQLAATSPLLPREFLLDTDSPEGLIYIIPRRGETIMGGTAEDAVADETVEPSVVEAITQRCGRAFPALRGAKILRTASGLRPGRRSVRLEMESKSRDLTIVHNYGHGGAGVTLSWGCAEEVAQTVKKVYDRKNL